MVEPPVAPSYTVRKANQKHMARNSKPGKKSDVTIKLEKEQAETDARNAERHEEMVAEEAAKVEAAANVAEPEVVTVAKKDREAAWKAFLKKYEEENPVKYAAKKKAGQFDDISPTFTGRNELKQFNVK